MKKKYEIGIKTHEFLLNLYEKENFGAIVASIVLLAVCGLNAGIKYFRIFR